MGPESRAALSERHGYFQAVGQQCQCAGLGCTGSLSLACHATPRGKKCILYWLLEYRKKLQQRVFMLCYKGITPPSFIFKTGLQIRIERVFFYPLMAGEAVIPSPCWMPSPSSAGCSSTSCHLVATATSCRILANLFQRNSSNQRACNCRAAVSYVTVPYPVCSCKFASKLHVSPQKTVDYTPLKVNARGKC